MSEKPTNIEWTRPLLKRFKAAYSKACKNSAERFKFEEHEFVTDYAKYLIQYLDNKLNGKEIK